MARIPDRMPAILEGDSLALWLSPTTTAQELPGLLGPARDDLLVSRPVSPLVNDAMHDGSELIEGISDLS